jgi:hypothetical protein
LRCAASVEAGASLAERAGTAIDKEVVMVRRTTVLILILAASTAAPAFAMPPAGAYRGYWGKSTSDHLAFSVKGKRLRDFHTTIAALCLGGPFGSQFETQTFLVPSAPIRANRVKITYKIRDSHGSVIGKRNLTAVFHDGHATGTLSGTSTGCTIAKYKWTAHH